MIVTEQKPWEEIKNLLKDYKKLFLIGCGECATTCNTGGEKELLKAKELLEKQGKTVTGISIPKAPCIAGQIKIELAKNVKKLKDSEAILAFSCGLGVQSVKDSDRLGLMVLPALDTIFGAVVNAENEFLEKCSLCAECILGKTHCICPVTLCPKGILNGPCGGMDKGKCEADKEKDCVWVLIYNEAGKRKDLLPLKRINNPRDFKKSQKPHRLRLRQN